VCQLELGRQAIADGAIYCLDCEKDLADVAGFGKARKEKKLKNKEHYNDIKEEQRVARKPRNRAIIEDSDDDEEGDGSWLVGKDKQGPLKLGKVGGIDDENAEGGGEWLKSEDDDDSEADETFPELDRLPAKKSKKKVITLDSDTSGDDKLSDSDSASEVEDEFQSSSDEEAHLATVVASTKINHLIKILGKEVAQHKFIVFSQFTSMLDLIEPFLRQKGFKFTRYDGKMRNDLREASLNKLRNDKSCRILLCSLKCGSLGLNLTAATRVVILEPFWNPVSTCDCF
jgi:SNF2 family DNA or RNA helicase